MSDRTGPRLSDFTDPESVEVYDPDVHRSPAGLLVTCSHCYRSYVCTPWDDLNTPAPELGYKGLVCDMCLLRLASLRTPPPDEP